MIENLLDQLYLRRRSSLLLASCMFLGLAYFWTRLDVEDSYERWMPQSAVRAWNQFDRHFPIGDTIVIGLEFDRPVTDEDAPHLRRFRAELEKIDSIARVLDCSKVADEIEAVPIAKLVDPKEGERFAFYRGGLFDRTGRLLVTVCEMGSFPPAKINPARRRAVEGIQRAIQTVEKDWRGPKFHVAGGAVVQFELEKMGRHLVRDLVLPLFLLSVVFLWAYFRTWVGVAVACLGSLWSVGILMGAIGAAGINLNAMTVAAPALMAVIVLATVVHFMHHAAIYPDLDDQRMVRWVAVPCFGAAWTTALGFLMLVFTDLAPIRELGLELCAGSILAFFGVVLAMFAVPIRWAAAGRLLSRERLLAWYRLVTRWPKSVVAATAVCTAVFLWYMYGLRVDADPFSFFKQDSPVAEALRTFSRSDFGLYPLHVVLVPKNRDDPNNAAAVRKFVDALKDLKDSDRKPIVLKVVSSAEFDLRAVSFSRAGLRRMLAFKDAFASFFDRTDEKAVRVTALAREPGEGFATLIRAARAAAPPPSQFEAYYTGAVSEIVILSDGLIQGLSAGLGTALVMMAVVCAFLFRSVRLGLLALVPNIFPVLAVYGVMGALDIPLSSGSAMVATIALGVVLNDTIHFVLQYRHRYEAGETTSDATSETFAEVGRPVMLIGAITGAGFAIFMLSDFRPLFHFGLLTSIAMVAAVTGDMIIMPNLLLVFGFKDRATLQARAAQHARRPELEAEAVPEGGR